MTTPQTIRIPVYTYGKYRAQDGTIEEFTDEKMRTLVKNTNFVIKRKPFVPTFGYVGYDHPVFGKVTDTNAHGHIVNAVYEDGVVSLDVKPIPDTNGKMRLIEDAKAGRRPHVSGEHHNAFSFVDSGGRTVLVGPTILGLAALGTERPAIKNEKIVPLSEIPFPESVTAADAFMAREAMRKSGVVAQTFSEGVLVFSEIQLSTDVDDTPKEQPMTADEKAEIARLIADATATIKTDVATQIAAVKTETTNTIKAMSETEQAKVKVRAKVETIVAEKKLSKIPAEKLLEAALEPTTERVLAFGETLSPVVLPGTTKTKKDGDKDDDPATSGDEPPPLAAVRVKHFSDRDKHERVLMAGLLSFAEAKPKLFAPVKDKPIPEQLIVLKDYVVERDNAN